MVGRSGSQPAVSMSPPVDNSGSIRHGRLLPRSLSAGWCAFKTAEKATRARSWSASPTGIQLRAVTTSPPGLVFMDSLASPVDSSHTDLDRLRHRRLQARVEPERLIRPCLLSTVAQRRRRSLSSLTRAAWTRFTARPRKIRLAESPHPCSFLCTSPSPPYLYPHSFQPDFPGSLSRFFLRALSRFPHFV